MKKFLATACTVVLLAACSCGQKISGTGAGVSSTVSRPVTDTVGMSADGVELTNIVDRVFFSYDSAELSGDGQTVHHSHPPPSALGTPFPIKAAATFEGCEYATREKARLDAPGLAGEMKGCFTIPLGGAGVLG